MLWSGQPQPDRALYDRGLVFCRCTLRAKTIYAATSQRVLIISQLRGRRVQAFYLDQLPGLILDMRGDGSGTIIFGGLIALQTWRQPGFGATSGSVKSPRFERIPEVCQEYDLIQRAHQENALPPRT